MAFPTVVSRTVTNETVNTTTHSATLPTTSAGDLLIAIGGFRGSTNSIGTPGGWTEITDSNTATATLWIAWRTADGTESGGTVAPTSAVSDTAGFIVYRITGQHASSAPEAGVAVGDGTGTSANPNPPNLAPSWGGPEDVLWIAACASGQSVGMSSFPTNYINGQNATSSGATPGSSGAAERSLNASSEDPGTFTLGGANAWVANTVAVRPAAAAGGTTYPFEIGCGVGARFID